MSTCCNCNTKLIKQWVNKDGTPYVNVDTSDPTGFTFGIHLGKPFNQVHKNTFYRYLDTSHTPSIICFTKHTKLYCALHRFFYNKWPNSRYLNLLCKCRHKKVWSCPNCGYM